MSSYVKQLSRQSDDYSNTSQIQEHHLLIAVLENAIRTIINKPESFEAKEDLKWLHGLEVMEDALHPDYIAEVLDSNIIDVLRAKFPLSYKGTNRLGYLSSYSMEEENLLLRMYKEGATKEELFRVFAPRKPYAILCKARNLVLAENWTKEEDKELLDLFKKSYRPYKIGLIMKKNSRAVMRRLNALGIDYVKKYYPSSEKIKIIYKILENKINFDDACRLLDRDPENLKQSVYMTARRLGYDTTGLLKKNRRATKDVC